MAEHHYTPEIIPARYAVLFDSSKVFDRGSLVAITPTSFAIGDIFRTRPSELIQRLGQYQDYLRGNLERGEIKLEEKYRFIVEDTPEDLRDKILSAIKDEKHTKKLWDYSEGDVIENGQLKYGVLNANVESRRDDRRKDVKGWDIVVKSPLYKEGPAIAYSNLFSQSDDYKIGRLKSLDLLTPHMASAILQLHDDYNSGTTGLIKIDDLNGMPYVPFKISQETSMDILVKHYLMKKRYYELDRILLDNPNNFDTMFLRAIENGFHTFGVIRRKIGKSRQIDLGYVRALNYTKNEVERKVIRAGYKKSILPVIEFKNTYYETICSEYERGDETIRLAFNRKFEFLIIHRKKLDDVEVFYENPKHHPISYINEEIETVDDKTRRKTKTKIMIPSALMLPDLGTMPIIGNLKKHYRRLIELFYHGDKVHLMRQLGLD